MKTQQNIEIEKSQIENQMIKENLEFMAELLQEASKNLKEIETELDDQNKQLQVNIDKGNDLLTELSDDIDKLTKTKYWEFICFLCGEGGTK